jgi:SAM-dependent methyltransferase
MAHLHCGPVTAGPENDAAELANAAEPTSLERQQLAISDASRHTFWHWVRFDVVANVSTRAGLDTVVDIGAGSGMLGDWLGERHPGIEYRFQELSPTLDAALADQFGVGARHIAGAPIRGAVVTMLDVIEHIEDPVSFLREVFDRMEPGGKLVVTVPALQWAFSSWDSELGHYRRYSKKSLRAELAPAGFVVDDIGYLFPEMLPLLPVRKLRRAKRESADFPELSPWLNRVGYLISSSTSRLRRVWPAGTSLVAVAHRPEA